MTPNDLHYTLEHEWVRSIGDNHARVGITDFAQGALGDIVFVQLPEVGARAEAGQPIAEVESTKSVSDVYAPAAGVVSGRNDELDASPELVNSDPYGAGWLFELTLDAALNPTQLLDADGYSNQVAEL